MKNRIPMKQKGIRILGILLASLMLAGLGTLASTPSRNQVLAEESTQAEASTRAEALTQAEVSLPVKESTKVPSSQMGSAKMDNKSKKSPSKSTPNKSTPPKQAKKARTISVTATGAASIEPDVIEVQLQIQTADPDFITATSKCNTIVEDLISSLKSDGVKREDLVFMSLQVYTDTDYPDSPETILMYRVTQTISVLIHDTENVFEIIDKIQNGNVTANGYFPHRTNIKEAYASAAENAMQLAKIQAEELAKISGVKLDPVPVQIKSEEVSDQFATYSLSIPAVPSQGGKIADSAFFGSMTIRVQLNVVYRIVNAK